MIGAPNSLNLNCKVRVMKEAPGPSVSEEIADIFTNYDIDTCMDNRDKSLHPLWNVGWNYIHSQMSTVITSPTLPDMWLLIHAAIKLNHVSKSGPRWDSQARASRPLDLRSEGHTMACLLRKYYRQYQNQQKADKGAFEVTEAKAIRGCSKMASVHQVKLADFSFYGNSVCTEFFWENIKRNLHFTSFPDTQGREENLLCFIEAQWRRYMSAKHHHGFR